INAKDGALAWETPFPKQGMTYNAATPIVEGDMVIFSGGGRGTKAAKVARKGDKYTVTERWSNPQTAVQFNTPVLKDGLLYGLSQGNEFFCLRAEDGKQMWTAP